MSSLGYFRFFVILGFIFILLSTTIGTLMPVWEARDLFMKVRASPTAATSTAAVTV